MRYKYLYLFTILLGMMTTGCESDFIEGVKVDDTKNEFASVITMVIQRTDGIISFSIDAPAHNRFDVWIDLNGDRKRATDGSEDVKIFNVYQEYALAEGIKSVDLHGDITYLGASSIDLTNIDVSGNPFLITLNVPLNKLESVNLSSSTALKNLDVSGNNISTLDISSNTMLESLWVYNNQLSLLDVSNNSKLSFLDCSDNALSALNLSNNFQLVRFLAYNNKLSSIDISNNTKLNRVWLFGNPLPDSEVERLISSLNEVIIGELWIADEPMF